MSDFGNKQQSGSLGTSGGTTPAATASGGFPTNVPIIPSNFKDYATNAVPGMSVPNPGLVAPGVVGSHSNVVSYADARSQGATQPTTMGSALQTLLHEQDPKNILALQKKLIRAGYLNPHDAHGFIAGAVSTSDATYYAYAQAMTDAIQKGENYNKLINGLISNPKNTLGQGYWALFNQDQQAAKNGGSSVTSTDVSTQLTDATDARAAAQQVYESELGRRLNDHEAQKFYHALDAFEAANPQVTKSTQNYNAAGQGTGSNSTTSGGIDPTQFAQSYVAQTEGDEYAKTQGLQAYNIFASLIGGAA